MSAIKDFQALKYGMFIHYGLYSILAGEYQGQKSSAYAEWIMNNLKIPREDYRKLAKEFAPDKFDSKEIVSRAKKAGMSYLCFTAKHHDGFSLYDSQVSNYNSMYYAKRDLVQELAEACAEAGIKFCLYYSQAQDWDEDDAYTAYEDNSQKNFDLYFEKKCLPQVRELLSNYGKITMLWFDTPMGMTKEQSARLRAEVKSLQKDCLISGRIGHGQGDYLTTQDNRLPAFPLRVAWELPGTLNHSWGYHQEDVDWTSPEQVIAKLVKIVARGGNYLLNIGPRGDGSVPEPSYSILEAVGKWLSLAGASIYGSIPIPPYVYETKDIYFTFKPQHLYIHLLKPEQFIGQEIPLPHIANTLVKARALGEDIDFDYRSTLTLEGDPYWGIMIKACPKLAVLTLDFEIKESEFLQEEIDRL